MLRMSAHHLEIEAGRFGKIEYLDLMDIVNAVSLSERKSLVMKFTLLYCAHSFRRTGNVSQLK